MTKPDCAARKRHNAGEDPKKRTQILDGAMRVFNRMGFDAASMDDITREAGVSKSTIYVYFSSKEHLFVALIDRHREVSFLPVAKALQSPGSTREKLTAFAAVICEKLCSEEFIRAHQVIIGVCERMPELGRRFYEDGPMRGHHILSRFFAAEVERGNLVIPDVELAAYQFIELSIAGLFRRRIMSHMQNPPSEAEVNRNALAAVDVFMSAYAGNRVTT